MAHLLKGLRGSEIANDTDENAWGASAETRHRHAERGAGTATVSYHAGSIIRFLFEH